MTHPGRLLVIDAANVIGSRPDGWWRDRAGAVARFIDDLPGLLRGIDDAEVVVVVEGVGRAGVEEGLADGIDVVHATGSGDDRIVEIVGSVPEECEVLVVTADRALRERVHALGAETVGPGWLWDARG